MLNSKFDSAFHEFGGLESQILLHASLDEMSRAFNEGYLKWTINGLGEAYGFWFRLKSNQKPLIVKTLVNTEGLDNKRPIEWTIDTASLDLATEVFEGLNLDDSVIAWKRNN